MDRLIELEHAIDKATVISFDIFDTLIIRLYNNSTDVFLQLQESYAETGFYCARVEGEDTARKHALQNGISEVTLEQIYQNMDKKYYYLMDKEIALEIACCKANREIKQIYEYALSKEKIIYISSDMYLPQSVIEIILHNNGYVGYKKLYISSATMKPKATGEMFDDILSESSVNPDKILHIGDNEFCDFRKATEKGISAFLYHKSLSQEWLNYNAFFEQNSTDSAITSFNLGNAKYAEIQEDFWYQFGYKYFGILLFSYCKWIHSEKERINIDKLFFMLRDGYIVKKVYNLLYPSEDCEYVYGSRRLFLFAGMESYEDIKLNVTGMHTIGLTYEQAFKRLGIKDIFLENEYFKCFDKNKIIVDERDTKSIDIFFEQHISTLEAIGKQERDNILKYFRSIGFFEKNIGVVDLGWKGSMLKSINKICKMEKISHSMSGFYLATHTCTCDGLHMNSFLMHNGRYKMPSPFSVLDESKYIVVLLELVFSAPFPSIINLKQDDNSIQPVYAELVSSEKDRIKTYKKIEQGILACVENLLQIDCIAPLKIQPNEAILPLMHIDSNLTEGEESNIAKINFLPGIGNDDTHISIATMVHAKSLSQKIISHEESIVKTTETCKDILDIPIRKLYKYLFYYLIIHFLQKLCVNQKMRLKYEKSLEGWKKRYKDFKSIS